MKKEKGVSLVELVLVVAAVGFLALLVSNLPSSISSKQKQACFIGQGYSRKTDGLFTPPNLCEFIRRYGIFF